MVGSLGVAQGGASKALSQVTVRPSQAMPGQVTTSHPQVCPESIRIGSQAGGARTKTGERERSIQEGSSHVSHRLPGCLLAVERGVGGECDERVRSRYCHKCV